MNDRKPYTAPTVEDRETNAFKLTREQAEQCIPLEGWHFESAPGLRGAYCVRNGFHIEPCPGEAHGHEVIQDHCLTCAPLWGVLVVDDVPPTPRDAGVKPKDACPGCGMTLAECMKVIDEGIEQGRYNCCSQCAHVLT